MNGICAHISPIPKVMAQTYLLEVYFAWCSELGTMAMKSCKDIASEQYTQHTRKIFVCVCCVWTRFRRKEKHSSYVKFVRGAKSIQQTAFVGFHSHWLSLMFTLFLYIYVCLSIIHFPRQFHTLLWQQWCAKQRQFCHNVLFTHRRIFGESSIHKSFEIVVSYSPLVLQILVLE